MSAQPSNIANIHVKEDRNLENWLPSQILGGKIGEITALYRILSSIQEIYRILSLIQDIYRIFLAESLNFQGFT